MEKKSFEELMETLEKNVKDLEEGNLDLDKSLEKYTEAMKIVNIASDKLNNAVKKVDKILKEDGSLEEFNVNE